MITQHWLCLALSLPGETWSGWAPQIGGCGWGQLSELYLDLDSLTTKALKPKPEPIVVDHRHSAPYEYLRGVFYRLYGHSKYVSRCPGVPL